MNFVELNIGTPVRALTYRNTYELEIEFAHGDADGETTREIRYPVGKEDKLKLDLLIIEGLDGGEYLEDQAEEILRAYGIEDPGNEIAEGFSDEFYEGDMTCEGNGAPICSVNLYFYDDNGVKHSVGYTVKPA